MEKLRISRLQFVLLSAATLANAISLADFTPRTVNLPPQCSLAYNTQIPGCSADDFDSTQVCSPSCLSGLVQVGNLVNQDCETASVPDTSIIGLFKTGQGIQVLCNVAVVTAGGPIPSATATIGQSTMVVPSNPGPSSGLLTDSSSGTIVMNTATQSSVPTTFVPTTFMTTSTTSATATHSTSHSTSTSKNAPSKTSDMTAAEESMKSGNVKSGGGSPFDNINNSGAVSAFTKASGLSCLITAIASGLLLALR